MNLDRVIERCSEVLRRTLLHNASMASGELFHSNMLAFLLEQTRPDEDEKVHELLESFLNFAGAPFQGPHHGRDLGLPREGLSVLREVAHTSCKLPASAVEAIDEAYVMSLAAMVSESDHDFVRREVAHFDLLVDLHNSKLTRTSCRMRPKRGKVTLNDRTLADVSFRSSAPRKRLVVELKVKSIATPRQLSDYVHRLNQLLEECDEGHVLLLALFPAPTLQTEAKLTLRTFHQFQIWLKQVEPTAVRQGVTWLPEYRRYLKLLTTISRCVWRLIKRAHHSEQPYSELDDRMAILKRCRLYASYLKLRASFMAGELERHFAQDETLGEQLAAGDLSEKTRQPVIDVYPHYSNGSGGFGVVLRHLREKDNVVESVGVQFQGREYRTYVSWDWKSVDGKLRRISATEVEGPSGHRVDLRRQELPWLAEMAGELATARAFDHRWRGFGRPYGDVAAHALLNQVYQDLLRVVEELSNSAVGR